LSIKGNKSSEFEILQLDHTFKHRYHAIVSTEFLIAPSVLANVYLQVVKMMTVIVGGLVISLKIIVIYTNVRLLELATLYH
jgi:hypothetical protein